MIPGSGVQSVGRFAGQVVIVTGGGSGIGRGSAERLSREGASVVVVDIDGPAAHRVAGELPGPAVAVAADVADEAAVDHYLASAVEAFGRVDLHHLNAGIFGTFAALPDRLYTGEMHRPVFERTASRLMEMQSKEYGERAGDA